MARRALLIAVEDSRCPDYPALLGPKRDVEALAAVLRDPLVGGFDSVQILEGDENESHVKVALDGIASASHAEDFLLVYFSGHSDIAPNGDLHLILGATTKRFVDSLAFSAVAAISGTGDCRQRLFILDCCFAGAGRRELIKGSEAERSTGKQAREYGIALLASSDPVSTSKINPVTNCSYFTEALVEGLRTGAADLNGDGIIDPEELFQFVKQRLDAANPGLHPWRSLDGKGLIRIASRPAASPPLGVRSPSVQLTSVPSDGIIYSRFDPARIWDGVRFARASVQILQTWFPGVESEVARYGERRQDVQYKILLISPGSDFVSLRIQRRKDFAFTFGEEQEKTTNIQVKIANSLRGLSKKNYRSAVRLFDSFTPGPIYFLDDRIYYGLFLPHTDAALGPLHQVQADSNTGKALQSTFDHLWSAASSPPTADVDISEDDVSPIPARQRIERLEREVSWLLYPTNRNDVPPFCMVEGAQIRPVWDVDALLRCLGSAQRRIYISALWFVRPAEVGDAIAASRARDIRVLLPRADSRFLPLRSRVLQGHSGTNLARELALRDETARRLSQISSVDLRYCPSGFMPAPVFVVDDSVFYGIYLRQIDPFRDPMHAVTVASDPGEAWLNAFHQAWDAAMEDDASSSKELRMKEASE